MRGSEFIATMAGSKIAAAVRQYPNRMPSVTPPTMPKKRPRKASDSV